jgi:hypothetical protein
VGAQDAGKFAFALGIEMQHDHEEAAQPLSDNGNSWHPSSKKRLSASMPPADSRADAESAIANRNRQAAATASPSDREGEETAQSGIAEGGVRVSVSERL